MRRQFHRDPTILKYPPSDATAKADQQLRNQRPEKRPGGFRSRAPCNCLLRSRLGYSLPIVLFAGRFLNQPRMHEIDTTAAASAPETRGEGDTSGYVQSRVDPIGRRKRRQRRFQRRLDGGKLSTSNTSNQIGGVYESRQVCLFSFFCLNPDTPPISLDVLDVTDLPLRNSRYSGSSLESYVQWGSPLIGRDWTCPAGVGWYDD